LKYTTTLTFVLRTGHESRYYAPQGLAVYSRSVYAGLHNKYDLPCTRNTTTVQYMII